MIKSLTIRGFKSVSDTTTLDLGAVNVFIGANGSGKSNILEAITLAAAAEANKLDNEFLSSRGIRVTDPHFMRSAFSDQSKTLPIKITISDKADKISNEYLVFNDNKLQWVDLSTKIQPELQVVWAGLEGIVPVKRYDFTVDMSVFQLPEIAKYKIFEEDTSTVEVSLYDYIRINYNWHNNNVTVLNFNLYTKDKGAEPVETKYSDQIEGVSAAYDTFKVYARKHPLLITEMLL